MAMTESSAVYSGNTDFAGGIFGDLKNLVIDYTRAKYIDVETRASDSNIPDQQDLRSGQAKQTSSDALGGTFGVAVGTMTPMQWAMLGLVLIGGIALIKKVV